jgi:hypothetical protein
LLFGSFFIFDEALQTFSASALQNDHGFCDGTTQMTARPFQDLIALRFAQLRQSKLQLSATIIASAAGKPSQPGNAVSEGNGQRTGQ